MVEGDAVTLVCRSRSGKNVKSVEWFINDDEGASDSESPEDNAQRLEDNNDKHIQIVRNSSNPAESKLSIDAAVFKHRAYYFCQITNDIGLSNKVKILVRVKGNAAKALRDR